MKKTFCSLLLSFFCSITTSLAANNYGYTETIRDAMIGSWLNAYYTQTQYGHKISGGFWGEAENMEILLDAYEATGDLKYKEYFDEVYKHFYATQWEWNYQKGNWMPNDFNDDIMWISIACLRAYILFGTEEYLEIGKRHFDATYERALTDQGLMIWRQWYNGTTQTTSGSNSCICGPTEVAACYLGKITGDESYFTKAKNMYAAQREYLYNADNGQVYDCFGRDQNDLNNRDKFSYNYWASTYNQGTFLGAACMLYKHYGDKQYYDDAKKIIDYCVNSLSNSDGYVNVCGSNNSDLDGFKGILMRYARRYIIDLCHPEYLWWMQKNCMGAYSHRRVSDGIIWTAWWQQTEDNVDYTAFGCGTAASLAVNTYIDDARVIKAGFSRIEAENFDYLKGVMVNHPANASANLGGIRNGYYTGYHNIDFGSNRATTVKLRYSAIDDAGSIEVRLNSPTGTLIGSTSLNSTGNWDTFKDIDCSITPISGMQDVYLVYKSANSYVCNVDYFQFESDSYFYNDITDNGGNITSSAYIPFENENLSKGIDNSADTKLYAYCGENPSELWIKYESPRKVRAYGYALCSANDAPSRDPKSWILQASTDGSSWVDLDRQTDFTFSARKEMHRFNIEDTQYYNFFRLWITERNAGGADFQIGEWQIYGIEDFSDNILTDGGSMGTSDPGNESNGEGMDKLTDKSSGKYLIFNTQTWWMEYEATNAYHPTCYTLTSANDEPTRDPLSWVLYGANFNEDWTELDRQTGVLFYGRNTTQAYPITCNDSYQNYRFEVLANGGANMTQTAELQIFGTRGVFPTDLTNNGGTLTASNYNTGNEGTEKIIDNLAKTKNYIYLGATFPTAVWYCYESSCPAILTSYTITSANDTPSRDPKSWKLQASNDGSNWVDLDAQKDITFTSRFQTLDFEIENNEDVYKYYRLYITERRADSDNGFQIAEWQLYGIEQIEEEGQLTTIAAPDADSTPTLYPSPVQDYLYIAGLNTLSPYTIYSVNGQQVAKSTLPVGEKISVSHLPSGLYILHVGPYCLKFIKQ